MTRQLCPTCRTPVIHTIDQPTAGYPITLNPYPVPRRHALLAIAAGRRAVTAETHRRHATVYWALTAWRINNPTTIREPHYIEHKCGETPPRITPPPKKENTCKCAWCEKVRQL